MKIDFYASERHYVDHLWPVWDVLKDELRGMFFAGTPSTRYKRGKHILVASLKDLRTVIHAGFDHIAFMEHGVGLTFGTHPSYAGGKGARSQVELFLAPNEFIRAKTERALPNVKQVVIGTPKMDRWAGRPTPSPSPNSSNLGRVATVCISFHWDCKVAPEAGSAFEHYRRMLPLLQRWKDFKIIGHGHPRAMTKLATEYEKLGIEVVWDFAEVMERADVYVCDASSTIYEFLVTGKPVVLMNAPQYRKDVHHGIRFWEYSNVGPLIDDPNELLGAILHALAIPDSWKAAKETAVRDLYPFLGESAQRAANALEEWFFNG